MYLYQYEIVFSTRNLAIRRGYLKLNIILFGISFAVFLSSFKNRDEVESFWN